jgi:predicted nucleotidyltransferase
MAKNANRLEDETIVTQENIFNRRKPKDRDFIETLEGLLFCVVGYLHPPDKTTAYLKYSPAEQGQWQRSGTAYHRELAFYHAHQVALTLEDLEQHYPQYIHDCPVRDMRFSMVPHDRVRTYYDPQARLTEILAHPNDALEEETVRVVAEIQRTAGIPAAELGITGSILLSIHNPAFSDIDLVVYGRKNAQVLRGIMSDLALEGASPMDEAYKDDWRQGVEKHFGLTSSQADWLVSRRWNFVYFGQGAHVVSLHPTRTDDEILEVYGEHMYRDAGTARIQATITNADDAIFLPAIYMVDRVHFLEGQAVELTEICTYEGLFGQIGEAGQRVEARGKLERIDGGPNHRLVIGSSHRTGSEYILPSGI